MLLIGRRKSSECEVGSGSSIEAVSLTRTLSITRFGCRLQARRVPGAGVPGPQHIFDSHRRSGGLQGRRSLDNVAHVDRTLTDGFRVNSLLSQ
jgi:hypothetical protein